MNHTDLEATTLSATSLLGPIKKLYYTEGHHLAEPTLKIFVAKIVSHLLCGAPIWGHHCREELDVFQNKFLHVMLALPHSTPGALLRTESGGISLQPEQHITQSCFSDLQKGEGWLKSCRGLMQSY